MHRIDGKYFQNILFISLAFFLLSLGNGCQFQNISSSNYEADLPEIKEKDTLKAIMAYSSTSYFLYRGQTLGYEYELAERLAKYLDLELEVTVVEDMNEVFDMLERGEGDIIAHNLTVTQDRKEKVDFTHPLNFTQQVLVQRKPEGWKNMKLHQIEKSLVRNPIRLLGKEVHVRENSAYNERLRNLEDELGGDINVKFLPGNMSTEEIIRRVDAGEIKYTVADKNIANIQQYYYSNIDIKTVVGLTQQLSWAVRKSSPMLLAKVNEWITEERKEPDFYVIYNKYFKNDRFFTKRVKSPFYSKKGNQISEYDRLIKNAAEDVDWDWRLLASQMYQESQFRPSRKSWAGAVGLMQLMPRTARSYGYKNLKNPESNIAAGTEHIAYLQKYWKKHIPDSVERLKIVLASYNAGHNHVQDARRLARKYGADPNVWEGNVSKYLKLKAKKEYYTDEVAKFGYCRGTEPVKYVTDILKRYKYYKQFIERDQPEYLASR